MKAIANFVLSSLRDRVQGFAQAIVLSKVANFTDIALFQTAELLNLVQLAETGIERLQELSQLCMVFSFNSCYFALWLNRRILTI